jgi:RNA polymerase sigma-70 factor (ECF subfamily)
MDNVRLPDSSAELMELWRAGNQQAAAVLWRRYAHRLIGLARQRLSTRLARLVDPEDLVQSAYRCFFVGARTDRFVLRHSGDLWRLLVAITLHKIHRQVQYHRAQKRGNPVGQSSDDAPFPDAMRERIRRGKPSAEEAVALTDELEWILRRLEPIRRQMVQLRLQGYEVEEIAATTGRHERTVRRTLEGVKDQLKARCGEYSSD